MGKLTDTIHDRRFLLGDLLRWFESFVYDRETSGLARRTVETYHDKLALFARWLSKRGIDQVDQITLRIIQEYLTMLTETGHNKGGVFSHYAPIRTFFHWYSNQTDTDNPLNKFRMRRPRYHPEPPADPKDVKALLTTCRNTFHGIRDRLIILALVDTGARAGELLALTPEVIDPITGHVHIIHGKGDRDRWVKFGTETRKAFRRYMMLGKVKDHLFINFDGAPLTHNGLRLMLKRRSQLAGVTYHTPHAYRRLCNLMLIKANVNQLIIMAYMGHTSAQIERNHYAALSVAEIDTAFSISNPVKNLGPG